MLKIVQANMWNVPQSAGVSYHERYSRFFATLKNYPVDMICVQEIVDPDLFSYLAAQEGFRYVAWSNGEALSSQGHDNFVGLVSKFPVVACQELEVEKAKCLFSHVVYRGLNVGVYSLHNAFGFLNEGVRLSNLHTIRDHVADVGVRPRDVMAFGHDVARSDGLLDIALCAGDFNAQPADDSVAWFSGGRVSPLDSTSTLWLTHRTGPTSCPSKNQLSAEMARAHGLNPAMSPDREIDYIFSYGWTYGKIGYPVSVSQLTAPTEHSDHQALIAYIMTKEDM